MVYRQQSFYECEFTIKDKHLKYFLSPILVKNNFKHGFFTKSSSNIKLSALSKHLKIKDTNIFLNQIHSNKIVLGSKSQGEAKLEADGLINDRHHQNLWIYTADCMPILVADKRKRMVAAIHCGRKGLETKIIKNLIKILYKKGCSKDDLLVAIGPSISKKNYLLDNKTLQDFYKNTAHKGEINYSEDKSIPFKLKKVDLRPFDIKKYAYVQLLSENIPSSNIDISNLCTFESNHDFYSWRKSKTYSRQWNFISS